MSAPIFLSLHNCLMASIKPWEPYDSQSVQTSWHTPVVLLCLSSTLLYKSPCTILSLPIWHLMLLNKWTGLFLIILCSNWTHATALFQTFRVAERMPLSFPNSGIYFSIAWRTYSSNFVSIGQRSPEKSSVVRRLSLTEISLSAIQIRLIDSHLLATITRLPDVLQSPAFARMSL